jgi:tryptophan synthase alpha chain
MQMSKVSQVFKANQAYGADTLIGYFPAGFPNYDESLEACVAMCENGVDILELGVPYSDPVMDGLVIQQATEVALANGFKLSRIFDLVSSITARVSTPVLVMTYWNPVIQYGIQRFARDLAKAGGAGLITPDLIVDEAGEWLKVSEELGLDRVFLATPSSSQDRVNEAVASSRGFVYAVSTMGITGAREDLDRKARDVVAKVRAADESQNVAVGIGISTTEQVGEVNSYADGAIVGSVFVRAYSNGGIQSLVSTTKELSGRK